MICLSHMVSYFPWACLIGCFCPDKDEDENDEQTDIRNSDLESGRTEGLLQTPTAPQISDVENVTSNKLLGVQIMRKLAKLLLLYTSCDN